MPLSPFEIDVRARRLRLLLFDVDGVLTDASVWLGEDGREAKRFSIRDGSAIVWARQAGLDVGLLSGRPSEATTRRAKELGIALVVQSAEPKRASFDRILEAKALTAEQVAYMGDDLQDLAVLGRVGLSAAPADAAEEVRKAVDWVSSHGGGYGAARDLVELVLRARGKWDALVSAQSS